MRVVQPFPDPPDPYTGDRLLQAWLRYRLGDETAGAARVAALAEEVTGSLRQAHRQAEANPPRLVRYDPWGARVDQVQTPAGWARLREAAVRHELVGLPYTQLGASGRVVQHALLHVFGPESATYSCPVAMTDGAAALLLHPEVDPAVRQRWLPRMTSTEAATAVFSGQWMTEASGGSDLSRAGTVARPAGDGSWRLSGDKWFCSAIDAQVAVALARPHGAAAGSRTLAPFLVPRYAADSPLSTPGADPGAPAPGVRVHRLKDKLGTRALPTAEVGLDDAYAIPLGDPTAPGLVRMMTLVRVARLHNAAAAAAGMRRGLSYAYGYATARQVAGGMLIDSALHRATLATLAVDTAGAFALAAHAFALLGRVENGGDEAAEQELRLVAPLAKLATAKLAVATASELLECFGGAGYVEDTGLPRLLRDAQVLPIWEGTTNVLSLDVLRALVRQRAGHQLVARVQDVADQHPALAAEVRWLTQSVPAVVADAHTDRVQAGARSLALRMANIVAAALLLAWPDEAAQVAGRLWCARWLDKTDIADHAYDQVETLCG